MYIIPTTISPFIRSNAEKKVFKLFSEINLDQPSVCFHSLRLSEHYYKRIGELDFVIITPSILLILEVKGGNVRCGENGIWTITDRSGTVYKRNESPFEQASSGMYSLIKLVKEYFGESSISKIGYGYGVIFPDCNFNVPSVEWSKDMIIDKRDFHSPSIFKKSIIRLISYWSLKNYNHPTLEANETKRLQQFLRPKFDLVESLGHKVEELDIQMFALTNEQYDLLDASSLNQHIICLGGAGTGKTFLALEEARRFSENGKRVLVVCKSKILSNYLRSQLRNYNVAIKNIETNLLKEEFEVLIIDEGQDVMNFEDFLVLDKCLKGGLEKGTWRIFLDRNNQIGIGGRFDEDAYELLKSFKPTYLNLTRNCRNTERIVNEVRLLTAADIGIAAAGAGPKVSYRYIETDQESVDILEKELSRLSEDDVALNDIAILSTKKLVDSIAFQLKTKFKRKITELNEDNSANFPFNDIVFSSISNFKGLESRFIFVIDIPPSLIENDELNSLYVAMTRARAVLFLILPKSSKAFINNLLLKNLSLIENKNKKR